MYPERYSDEELYYGNLHLEWAIADIRDMCDAIDIEGKK